MPWPRNFSHLVKGSVMGGSHHRLRCGTSLWKLSFRIDATQPLMVRSALFCARLEP